MAKVILSRRETFCASHRLHSKHLSDEQNKQIFGKCNRPNGHGHNYTLEVSLKAEVDKNGLIMNLFDLEQLIEKHVLSKVDHRHMNLDVPEFADENPTVECMAVVIWKWLEPHLKGLLYEVRLHETENNFAIYRGE